MLFSLVLVKIRMKFAIIGPTPDARVSGVSFILHEFKSFVVFQDVLSVYLKFLGKF